MRYEFGVMSSKYELEAEDTTQANIAMSIFIRENVPIAVYSPKKYSFMSKDILEKCQEIFDPEIVRDILKTIKKLT